jgi:hypothetical protein
MDSCCDRSTEVLKGILRAGFEEIELIELFEEAIEHHYFFG